MNASYRPRLALVFVLFATVSVAFGAPAPVYEARDRQIRARYEQVLLQNPFQDRAFNQVFEDLKLKLVGVYEDIGDLAGLVKYIQARLGQSAGDVEFRDFLAETYTRMAKFDAAEKEYKAIL